jgi:hypothetical protein
MGRAEFLRDRAQRPHLGRVQPAHQIEEQGADAETLAPERARRRWVGQGWLGRLVVGYLAGVEVERPSK